MGTARLGCVLDLFCRVTAFRSAMTLTRAILLESVGSAQVAEEVSEQEPFMAFGSRRSDARRNVRSRKRTLPSAARVYTAAGIRMNPSRWLGVSFGGLCLFTVGAAFAQESRIDLDYTADDGCPNRSEFVAWVRMRTQLAEFVETEETERRFAVSAKIIGGRAVGSFVCSRGSVTGSARQVTSERCDDVVSALALIVALAVDPHARLDEVLQKPNADAAGAKPDGVTAQSTSLSVAPRPEPQPTSPPAAPESRLRTGRGSWLFGVSANGGLWASSPSVAFGGLAVAVQWQPLAVGVLAPAISLTVEHEQSPTVHAASGGGVRFGLSDAVLALCPLRLSVGSSVTLRPCFGASGGWVAASGVREGPIFDTLQRNRPWWSIQQSVQMQADLGKLWLFDTQVGLAEPLWRDDFVFDFAAATPASTPRRVTIASTPAWLPRLSLGVARRF
jgi:hypothetical protein